MAFRADWFERRTLYKVVRGGVLACIAPLSLDAIMSLLSRELGSYAPPFFYPIFFVLGAAFAFDAWRKRGPGDEKE